MSRNIFKTFFCVFYCILFKFQAYGQDSILNDTASTVYARSLFVKANARQSRLFNGREYIPNDPSVKDHPFFLSKDWTKGSINYDGASFSEVPMLYDLTKDEVVVLNFLLPDKLSLVKQKVQEFNLHEHRFIYLKTDSSDKVLSPGFYDLLYRDKISVLVKRRKIIKAVVNTSIKASFEEEDRFFMIHEGISYPVKTLPSVLKVLKDKKPEIQQYLRKNGIIFRDNPEKAIVAIASQYDQLSN